MTNSVPQHNWHSIASSSDGSRLVAAIGYNDSGSIYVSTNAGATWIQTDSPIANWYSVASSTDGNTIIAAAYGDGVYSSTNGGIDWITNGLPSANWVSVASSADGTTFVALTEQSMLCISTNSGITWMSTNSLYPFFSPVLSADGRKAFAMGSTGFYTLQFTPNPQLNITTLTNNIVLSWLVPSTFFALQQNLDLNTTNWVTLTNTPVLNPATLHDETILSPAGSSGYYRLVSP
jgi:photosystem II stability/assembly factor-like uncharacterized protein